MNILLVNNRTIHIKRLAKLAGLHNHAITLIDGRTEFDQLQQLANMSDLIILSGGSTGRSVSYDPKFYDNQFRLVQQTNKPVIGVCLGAQIIAAAYGSRMRRLANRSRGQQHISITRSSPIFRAQRNFKVHQSHFWVIDQLGPQLQSLAISSNGHEVIKHKSKPLYGLQFHPEVFPNYTSGSAIFHNILRLHTVQPITSHD